jgi:hypothetical protein
MKTLKLLFGIMIASVLLFTACDKTENAQCITEQYKKDIVGEWAAINPNGLNNPEIDYLSLAFNTFGNYAIIQSDNKFATTVGRGRSNGYDDIHDTLYVPTNSGSYTWDIDDKELTIEIAIINQIYTYKIEYINEDEMALTTNTEGAGVWTEYYRRVTEEDMVYVWSE